jgi:hypothetical protein
MKRFRVIVLAMFALLIGARPARAQQAIDASAIRSDGDLAITADALMPTQAGTAVGSLTQKWGPLYASELWVETLVAQDTMATLGGRVLVSPTTTLVQDLDDDDTIIHVKHNDLVNGDPIVLQANGQTEHMAVTSSASGSAGDYSYSVTRDMDGSGANAWSTGDAVVDTEHGYIDLYSVNGLIPGDTAGPTIAFNARTGTDWDDIAPRAVIGNLDGTYGYSSTTFGAAFGDPDAAWLKIDAADGVRIGYGGTTKISLDAAGNADITGALSAGSITTDKLAIGAAGAALSPDPNMLDATAWATSGTGSGFQTVTDGKVGTRVFRSGATQGNVLAIATQRVPVDLTKTYRIHGWARRNSAGNGNVLIGVSLYDANGDVLDSTGTAHGGGTLWWYACSMTAGSLTTDTWASCDAQFGANATKTLPSNARTMSPLALLNVSGSAGYEEVQDLRIEEALPATLIQDGIITTTKLAANAVTAAKIAANTITASEIAANAITTSELASDSVTSAKIVAGTIVASDIASSTITADKLSVSSLSAISANIGTITSGTINGTTIHAGVSNSVTLDSNGITLSEGTSRANSVWWSDGSYIHSFDGDLTIHGEDNAVTINSNLFMTGSGAPQITALSGSGNRYVCVNSTGSLFASASACP